MKLYCLSGLGVDKRAFQNIDLPNTELIHIPWIEPKHKESLKEYALRLFDSVDIGQEYSLMGVSFGGMIATEFAKIRKPQKLYLISTIQSRGELRFLFKIGGFLGLHKLIPARLVTRSNFITNYLFGTKTEQDKKLLKEILADTDPKFLKWALGAILHWENSYFTGTGIHGDNDKILSYSRKMDIVIPDGGHFMIVTKGKEISSIIKEKGV